MSNKKKETSTSKSANKSIDVPRPQAKASAATAAAAAIFIQDKPEMDAYISDNKSRILLKQFLKELNDGSDQLLLNYILIRCFKTQQYDPKLNQNLGKTYDKFIKNKDDLNFLKPELRQKLYETWKKSTYNEKLFNDAEKEMQTILESRYFPIFLKSKIYKDSLKPLPSPVTHTKLSNSSHNASHSHTNEHHKNGENRPIFDSFLNPFRGI
jgi:hypothetical protein